MQSLDLSTIKAAIKRVRAAKEDLSAEVANEFPLGGEVSWEKGGHVQCGIVLNHGGIGRTGHLRVENERTGARYWITMYDVLGYVE